MDVALIVDTYHHLEYPQMYMTSVRCALAPGGSVLLIDFHRADGMEDTWVLEHVRAGEDLVIQELSLAGLEVDGIFDVMQRNYTLRLVPSPHAPPCE